MRIGITHKIAFVFISAAAVVFLAVFFYFNYILTDYVYQRIRENLSRQLRLSALLLEKTERAFCNSYSMDIAADVIGKELGVRVTVIALDGKVFGDSGLDIRQLQSIDNHLDRPEIIEALSKGIGRAERFSSTLESDILYMAKIFGANKPCGIIRLAVPLSDIRVISNRLKNALALALIIAFVISMILFFIVSTCIARPLREISLTAKNIALGDFSKRPSVTSDDEVGALAEAIRFMSDEIKSKIEEVNANKARLEAVLLSMFEGVMVIDNSANIVLINRALKELLQVDRDLSGKATIEIIRNADIQDIVDAVLKHASGVLTKEILVLAPVEKNLIVHAAPVIREGRNEAVVLVFHDITDLKRLESIRKDFVANVSHELRTPVSNIQGYAETLLRGAIDDKEHAKDFLGIIHSDAQRLSSLINDLLDLAKMESGKLTLELKYNDLTEIIETVVPKLAKSVNGKNINLDIHIADSAKTIFCDRNKIAQVLFNLIENAVKYTRPGGTITIRVLEEKGFIRVDVSDTGIGIPAEHLSRIFERFYRVDKARSRELGGTGLGLAIVKHIVQSHSGEVWVKSAPGKGSVFSFTLPIK
ncbi:MAG: ATP-binding protein [Candidatus Omnitrophica bacterium]|nr:ATP-binding protein [Candidatus Omnitrophota bacterium]